MQTGTTKTSPKQDYEMPKEQNEKIKPQVKHTKTLLTRIKFGSLTICWANLITESS